jgi:diacylglycerol O-acyltransferase / wax synthase
VGVMPLTDAMFLLAEARERPMHVGGLQLYRLPEDAEPKMVGATYRRMLEHGEVIPRLRRRASRVGGLGPWRWEEDPDLDLEYHVRHSALPEPGRVRELLALVSRLHGTLLDRSRPLWEAHLIEGLSDGRIATYTKIHHALMDGVSQMRLLERSLSADPDERSMAPPLFQSADAKPRGDRTGSSRNPVQLAGEAVTMGVEGIRGVVGATDATIRTLFTSFSDQAAALPYRAPASALNVPISSSRRFAADDWPLERLRIVGKSLGGTVNDVVLAMCAGALRRYLLENDGLPDDPLVAMVPVSLRDPGDDDDDSGNAVGLILCNLGTHLADPLDRFELIHRSTETGKMRLKGLNQTAIMMLGAMSMAPLGTGALYRLTPLRKPPFNVVISNVPGPRHPLYWNGAELVGSYPASIPVDGQALNITCTSWADRIGFGLTGCRRSLPSLQRLLEHLETALQELESAA